MPCVFPSDIRIVNSNSLEWLTSSFLKNLQVTKGGEPVTPFAASHGKRPYERLLIASNFEKDKDTIPDGLVICSVPSGVHSHKPPLDGKNW